MDADRVRREARIDQAVADLYWAQDERAASAQAVETADRKAGQAIVAIMAEGVPIAKVAVLAELNVNQVHRLKALAASGQPHQAAGRGEG
jgi:hypothetical protein